MNWLSESVETLWWEDNTWWPEQPDITQTTTPFVYEPLLWVTAPFSLNIQRDLDLAAKVRQSGRPNAYGCRIQLNSDWKFTLLDSLATSTSDRETITYLKYGWPLNRELPVPLSLTWYNHKGATDHPGDVTAYINKELEYNTLVGPLSHLPTQDRMAISPMSTRPKKNSCKRRIITDLSWPLGSSVNDGIPKNEYMGQLCKLRYPTVDDLCNRAALLVKQYGPGSVQGYKVDLHRAF